MTSTGSLATAFSCKRWLKHQALYTLVGGGTSIQSDVVCSCPLSIVRPATLQFDGPGVAPVSITMQTALELAIADVTPMSFTCGIVRINTTADNLHGVITMAVTTAHPAGQYSPQVCSRLTAVHPHRLLPDALVS
jgi:hypothetical protein